VTLLFFAPLILFIALAVRLRLGAPVIFRHERPGYLTRPFILYKFRTMTDGRGPDGRILPDADRMTRFGSALRRFSLDELPQLWNVLRGDMSLVGPRPLMMQYLQYYSPEQSRRHNVKPGITGWAQINGRNTLAWEQKFDLDVWYVDNWDLWLDFVILCRTIVQVLAGRGISSEGHVTMQEFVGTQEKSPVDSEGGVGND
jgi:sugar transferase EpsL